MRSVGSYRVRGELAARGRRRGWLRRLGLCRRRWRSRGGGRGRPLGRRRGGRFRLRSRRLLLLGFARRWRPGAAVLALWVPVPCAGSLAFGAPAPRPGSPALGAPAAWPGSPAREAPAACSGSPPSRGLPAILCPSPSPRAPRRCTASPDATRLPSAMPLRSAAPAAGRLALQAARLQRAAARFPDRPARRLMLIDLPQPRLRRRCGWILATGAAAGRDQGAGGEQRGESSHVSPSHPAQQRRGTACPPPVHARFEAADRPVRPRIGPPLASRSRIGSLLSCPAR